MSHGSDHGPSPSFPSPERDLNPSRADTGSVEVGWDTGSFADGRPYVAECWAEDGMTVVTFFFSRLHMEASTEDEIAALLEGENLVRWISGPRRVSARPFRDKAGSDMWTASVVVGLEDDRFIDDNLRLKPYPRTVG